MQVIIKDATMDYMHIHKTEEAVKLWLEQQTNTHNDMRITVEWLSKYGCNVYSKGNKDKLCFNIH